MIEQLNTLDSYKTLIKNLSRCSQTEKIDISRHLCRTDLFFLLWYGFGRKDIFKDWLLARCKEIQAKPDEHLDLWAREHYKSTIITYALTIKDILSSHGDSPLGWSGLEPTFGIFSCTRPLAKGFLRQIKREFEGNQLLRALFPDVVWENCAKEAPKWSEDDGLVLKRKSNPKESTVEAWGIVDGQPTSKHFTVCIYDDVVTVDNVRSPNMIAKTTESWELSINLGSDGGKRRYVGTRYHFNDTYRSIISRGVVTARVYAATEDGLPEGEPVLLTKEALVEKRKAMGPYTFACQMLLNPLADETQGFKREWLRFHSGSDGAGLNLYIVIDPASEKKKQSDYTVMTVIGLGSDKNYYLLDMIRDRLNLKERTDALFHLHKKWRPLGVGYERYGMQADIAHIKERQHRENYHFDITELMGAASKIDRIKGMIPDFADHRWYFPESIFKTNYEGKVQELVDIFINEEMMAFPVSVHDDMLDCLSRIRDEDLNAMWPRIYDDTNDRYSIQRRRRGSSWAA